MELYLFIALLTLCFYQDLRFRGIHWSVFPLLLVGSFWLNDTFSWWDILSNCAFLTATMGMLTIYLSLKEGHLVRITQGYFSWGDILFLLAMTPLFGFYRYLLFFTLGTCLTLVMHLIASMISKQNTVPYAGYMAAFSVGFLFFYDQLLHYLTV